MILGLLLLQQLECPFLYYDRIGRWHTPRTLSLSQVTISIGLSFRVSIFQLRRCSYFYQNPLFVVGPITEMACTIQLWSTQYHKERDHEKKAQVLKKKGARRPREFVPLRGKLEFGSVPICDKIKGKMLNAMSS